MAVKQLSFEHAYSRLEEIAELLESGTTSLEDTMALFEEANKLNKQCSKLLDQAESKLKIILKEKDEFQLEIEEN
jgi:exodeoxyribonuclease VII small subunit